MPSSHIILCRPLLLLPPIPPSIKVFRQHIKKQRYNFANKDFSSQRYGFSSGHVWMWELEYKVEHQRIDAFELWCWRKLMRVPWTARRSNQSILKEFSPGYSLEGLMLKLKLQYFGHLIQRADSFEKTLMLRKIEGGEGDDRWWDGWMASLTQWTWVWVNSRSWWWTGRPGVLQSMGSQRIRHKWVTFTSFHFMESVMPYKYLILCHPLHLLPSIFPRVRVLSNESALCIRWPKYWSFSCNINPSNKHPRLISFRMDWLDLLAVQGTLKSLLNTTVQKHQFFSAQHSL